MDPVALQYVRSCDIQERRDYFIRFNCVNDVHTGKSAFKILRDNYINNQPSTFINVEPFNSHLQDSSRWSIRAKC